MEGRRDPSQLLKSIYTSGQGREDGGLSPPQRLADPSRDVRRVELLPCDHLD